jgi:hypothetical protein
VHRGIYLGNRVGDHLENRGLDGRIILKYSLQKWDLGSRTGSSLLRIGTGGELL